MSRNLCSAHRSILYAETGEKVLVPTPEHPAHASRSGQIHMYRRAALWVARVQWIKTYPDEPPVIITHRSFKLKYIVKFWFKFRSYLSWIQLWHNQSFTEKHPKAHCKYKNYCIKATATQ